MERPNKSISSQELDPTPHEGERLQIDNGKYRNLAAQLVNKHWDDIDDARTTFPPLREITHELREIPDEIIEGYYGHGVSRGSDEDQVASILSIIENQAVSGDIGELGRSQHISAYTTGGFLVIFNKEDTERRSQMSSDDRRKSRIQLVDEEGNAKFALKLRPLAIVCNSHMNSLVSPLRNMYPNTVILSTEEVGNFLTAQETKGSP